MNNSEEYYESDPPVVCGHCGNISPMRIKGRASGFESKGRFNFECGDSVYILQCLNCFGINVIQVGPNIEEYDYDTGGQYFTYDSLYPQDPYVPLGLPDHVRTMYQKIEGRAMMSDYDQTGTVVREYAASVRALFEKIYGGKSHKENLKGKIDELFGDKGYYQQKLPKDLRTLSNSLRKLANAGVHSGTRGSSGSRRLDHSDIFLIRNIARVLLDVIYRIPYLIDIANTRLDKETEQNA